MTLNGYIRNEEQLKINGKHVPQETKIRTVKSREKRKEIVI